MTWTDARILHGIWAQHFDPNYTSLEYAGYHAQEAWLSVATAAKLIAESPSPAPTIIPGLPYLARFHKHDGWADKNAPSRPQLVLYMNPSKLFVIETRPEELPTLTGLNVKPTEIREVPGLIYQTPPMQFSGVGDEAIKPRIPDTSSEEDKPAPLDDWG